MEGHNDEQPAPAPPAQEGAAPAAEDPKRSQEELVELARSNARLGMDFLKREEAVEALDAFAEALSLYREAFGGDENVLEAAPVYLRYGTTLMRVAERNMEKALNDVMVNAMQQHAAAPGDAQKLTSHDIEEHANEHLEDLDDAWEALEMARLAYEAAQDNASVADTRMALGDLCMILEDWEGANREFSGAAELRRHVHGDDRRTVEALFLAGMSRQAEGHRSESLAAFTDARDTMARIVAAHSSAPATDHAELVEFREILQSLEEKVAHFDEEMEEDDEEDGDEEDGSGAGVVVEDEEGEDGGDDEDVAQKRVMEEEHDDHGNDDDSGHKKAKTE